MSYIRQFCPYDYKYQLVDWAVRYKGIKRHKALKIKKQGLYAMWYKRNQ